MRDLLARLFRPRRTAIAIGPTHYCDSWPWCPYEDADTPLHWIGRALHRLATGLADRRPVFDLTDPKVRLMAWRELMRQERAEELRRRLHRENAVIVDGEIWPPRVAIWTGPFDRIDMSTFNTRADPPGETRQS